MQQRTTDCNKTNTKHRLTIQQLTTDCNKTNTKHRLTIQQRTQQTAIKPTQTKDSQYSN